MEWRGVVNVGNLKGTEGLDYGDAAVTLGKEWTRETPQDAMFRI